MKTQKNQSGKAQQIEVERLDVEELGRRVAPLTVSTDPTRREGFFDIFEGHWTY